MAIQKISDDIILVELPSDSQKIAVELEKTNEKISNSNCDVIIDFSMVEILNSSNISNLLILRSLLTESGNQLVFSNVAMATKCIFVVAGLSDVFVFTDDKLSAISLIKSKRSEMKAHT
jgi:anti-anti-sigma regulatory factor